jgi:hypothetical protein
MSKMSKTFTTLTACALSLALTVPAFAGTAKTAPINTPVASESPSKADGGKSVVTKRKHSKKSKHGKSNASPSTPAVTPAPEKH